MNSKTLFYVLKRIGLAILTIWVVITITFFVMHAVPGGPFVGEKATTPAVQAAMEAKYGLDKPVYVQLFMYLKNILPISVISSCALTSAPRSSSAAVRSSTSSPTA